MKQYLRNIIFLFLFCNSLYSQDTIKCREYVSESIDCMVDHKVTINLEKGYIKRLTTYEEGFIITFSYPNTSYILVLCGRMIKTPMLSDKKYREIKICDKENSMISRIGLNTENHSYWREDNYKSGFIILYDNVSESQISIYNSVLETVIIK